MFKKTLTKGTPSKNLTPHFVFMKSNEVKHHQIHHCMALKSSIFDKNEPLSYHFTQKFSFFELVWTIFQRKYFIYEIFTQRADFILSEPLIIGAHRRAKRGCILARILDSIGHLHREKPVYKRVRSLYHSYISSLYNSITLTMSEVTIDNWGTDIENVSRLEDISPTSTQFNQVSKDRHLQKSCPVCFKCMKSDKINRHLKTHDKIKSKYIMNSCTICGKSMRRDSLKRHLKTHDKVPSLKNNSLNNVTSTLSAETIIQMGKEYQDIFEKLKICNNDYIQLQKERYYYHQIIIR